MQIHTPTVVQGGGGREVDGNALVIVFDMLQYFETIFSTRWGIFYGGGVTEGPVTSPNMVAILDFTEI